MVGIFDRLGMPARRSGSGEAECLSIDPPSWRFDLRIEEDLIEEVARVWGFERIPAKPPIAPVVMLPASELVRSLHDLRHTMAASEFREVINFSFVEASWESDFSRAGPVLQLLNPIASQMSVMRSTLAGGLIANLRFNLNRKMSRVRVFEIGRVFWRDPAQSEEALAVQGIAQPVRIAALAFGPVVEEQWGLPNRCVDFYDLKNDLEHLLAPKGQKQCGGSLRFVAFTAEQAHPALHPGRSARVILDGRDIGWIGELHPRHQAAYELPQVPVLFELDTEPLLRLPLAKHAEVSRFPAVTRDFAVVVPEQLAVQSMLDAMRAIGIDCLKSVSLFDLYRGQGVPAGCKSLAFRVIMQENQRTMTDQDADAVVASLLRVLSESFGASLRS
jgi:phenylalanyl-tRNA synthetase beta chain